jgi:hypothetical protein
LRTRYVEVIGEPPPPKVHLFLVQLRVAYELQVREIRAAGRAVSEMVTENYEASKQFDVSAFTGSMRKLICARIAGSGDLENQQKEEETMGTKKKTSRKKAPSKKAASGQGRTEFEPDLKIKQLVAVNPKKPGSASAKRFDLYRKSKTVSDYIAAGGTYGDLRWDLDHRLISVEGVKPSGSYKMSAAYQRWFDDKKSKASTKKAPAKRKTTSRKKVEAKAS